jgi:DNA-binding transcriptional LysR family regulator
MDRLVAMDVFVHVVDAGSFSGAAKQLHMGQSAVSKAIAQLEERLRARLLLRTTRRLTPTEAGRDFYERVKRSIEEVHEAELAASGASHFQAACAFSDRGFRAPARHTLFAAFWRNIPDRRRSRY